ncbi:MAG: PrsW family glutamic-type intramembrane protease, partial [Gemmatimonas sp.]
LAVCAGVAAALGAYVLNQWLRPTLGIELTSYARYVAPVVEESLKATYVVVLLARNRVGFVVDAAIYGFAVGTGFAAVENLHYMSLGLDASPWLWVVRGCGTAVMHGAATALVAMIARTLHHRTLHHRTTQFVPYRVLPALVAGIVLHSLYNHLLVEPLLATAAIMIAVPVLAIAAFEYSERDTRSWLGTGFDTDQELLRAMKAGNMATTPVGQYLASLRARFAPEVIVDMLCLLRLRAELGIRAKGILLMREAGFEPDRDPSIRAKFEELRYLEGSIGATGRLAMVPFMRTSARDLWQLNLLDEGTQ